MHRYDTFEMLRENLDTVLKDLLEFKNGEKVHSKYPGIHLDLNDDFLKQSLINFYKFEYSLNSLDEELQNRTEKLNDDASDKERSAIIRRIRRYLNQKSKGVIVPFKKMNHKLIKLKKKLHQVRGKVRSKRTLNKLLKRPHQRKKSVRKKRYIFKEFNTSFLVNRGRKLQMYKARKAIKKRAKRNGVSTKPVLSCRVAHPNRISNTNEDDPSRGDATLKARFLFKSCMNYSILQRRGHQPLLDLLSILGGWPILDKNWNSSNFDWLGLMASLRLYNNDILISEWVGPDIKNSDEFVIQFDQTSLGKKPDKTLYFLDR